MERIYPIDVPFDGGVINTKIMLVKNDINTNKFVLRLRKSKYDSYPLDLSGLLIKINTIGSTGIPYSQGSVEIIDIKRGLVSVLLNDVALESSGSVRMEVTLYGSTTVATSSTIVFNVKDPVVVTDASQSPTEGLWDIVKQVEKNEAERIEYYEDIKKKLDGANLSGTSVTISKDKPTDRTIWFKEKEGL